MRTPPAGIVAFHGDDPFEAIARRAAEEQHGLKIWVLEQREADGFDICKMVEVEADEIGMPDEEFGLALGLRIFL